VTTLEIVLICVSGVETVLTCLWTIRMKRQINTLMVFALTRAIKGDVKEAEYHALLDEANVWINAR
jgi:hypothetical protein